MSAPSTRLLGTPGFQPRGLAGSAATKPARTTREMVEVLDPYERVQHLLPLGHPWIEGTFYARVGFSMRKIAVSVDARGRCVR